MAWRRTGDKSLPEPMPTCSPTHICGTKGKKTKHQSTDPILNKSMTAIITCYSVVLWSFTSASKILQCRISLSLQWRHMSFIGVTVSQIIKNLTGCSVACSGYLQRSPRLWITGPLWGESTGGAQRPSNKERAFICGRCHEALWFIRGLKGGGVNLYQIRHATWSLMVI